MAPAALAALIGWEVFERGRAGFSVHDGTTGGLAASLGGLLCLQHAFRLSDEAVVARWVENPFDGRTVHRTVR